MNGGQTAFNMVTILYLRRLMPSKLTASHVILADVSAHQALWHTI